MTSKEVTCAVFSGIDPSKEVAEIQKRIGTYLVNCNYRIRLGMDEPFITGIQEADGLFGKIEMYLPWKGVKQIRVPLSVTRYLTTKGGDVAGFGGEYFLHVPEGRELDASRALAVAKSHHLAWNKVSTSGQKFMISDVYRLLGQDLEKPVDFVVGYYDQKTTPLWRKVAESNRIPVFNIGSYVKSGELNEKKLVIDFNLFLKKYKKTAAIEANANTKIREIAPDKLGRKAVCFDTETTGFHPERNELLQISIVDSKGVLFDSYVKPYHTKRWDESMAVHHITPKMVENAPYPHEIRDIVCSIFNRADVVIGHNVPFDKRFVSSKFGYNIEDSKTVDTLKVFKEFHPKGSHKLGEAVDYYCPEEKAKYEQGAHSSLTDTLATFAVYSAQIEAGEIFEFPKECENDMDR